MYTFEHDKSLCAWYCWEVRWKYLDLIEWVETQYPFLELKIT